MQVRSRNSRSAGGRSGSTSSRRYCATRRSVPPNHPTRGGAPVGEEEGREREGGRPSLRAGQEQIDLRAPDLPALGLHQRRGLCPGHRELARAELGHAPLGAHPRDRQRRRGARGDRQRRRARQIVDDAREGGDRSAVPEHLHVVEGEHERRVRVAPARHRDDRAPDRREQPARVVVALVERDPGERALVVLAPLHEQGRLAVARRRDQHGDRRPAGLGQRLHQSRTRHVRGRDERPGGPAPQERRDVADVPERLRRSDALHEPIVDRRRAHHRHEHPPARAPRARGCASRSHGGQPPVRRGSAPHLAVASFIPTG